MVREELDEATDALRGAAANADGWVAERLSERADNLETLDAGEGGVDRETLDRHTHELRSLADDVDDEDVREAIDLALERLGSYRESI